MGVNGYEHWTWDLSSSIKKPMVKKKKMFRRYSNDYIIKLSHRTIFKKFLKSIDKRQNLDFLEKYSSIVMGLEF